MPNPIRTFFDHSRHKLSVHNFDATLDVLAFHGEEQLSQPFHYVIEFTCTEQDIAADQLLNRDARFSLHAPPRKPTFLTRDLPIKPLRTLHGVVTGFKRLSGSVDEARYEITLQPRLALLARGQQFRLYQHQSVPEIGHPTAAFLAQYTAQLLLQELVDGPESARIICPSIGKEASLAVAAKG